MRLKKQRRNVNVQVFLALRVDLMSLKVGMARSWIDSDSSQ